MKKLLGRKFLNGRYLRKFVANMKVASRTGTGFGSTGTVTGICFDWGVASLSIVFVSTDSFGEGL